MMASSAGTLDDLVSSELLGPYDEEDELLPPKATRAASPGVLVSSESFCSCGEEHESPSPSAASLDILMSSDSLFSFDDGVPPPLPPRRNALDEVPPRLPPRRNALDKVPPPLPPRRNALDEVRPSLPSRRKALYDVPEIPPCGGYGGVVRKPPMTADQLYRTRETHMMVELPPLAYYKSAVPRRFQDEGGCLEILEPQYQYQNKGMVAHHLFTESPVRQQRQLPQIPSLQWISRNQQDAHNLSPGHVVRRRQLPRTPEPKHIFGDELKSSFRVEALQRQVENLTHKINDLVINGHRKKLHKILRGLPEDKKEHTEPIVVKVAHNLAPGHGVRRRQLPRTPEPQHMPSEGLKLDDPGSEYNRILPYFRKLWWDRIHSDENGNIYVRYQAEH